ncbi:unnamed protein product, partial [Meganyctiphanes norvegica]
MWDNVIALPISQEDDDQEEGLYLSPLVMKATQTSQDPTTGDFNSNTVDNESAEDEDHLLSGDRCMGQGGGFWDACSKWDLRRPALVAVILVILFLILVAALATLGKQGDKLSDYNLQQLSEELISIDKDYNNVFHQLDITLLGPKLLHGLLKVFNGSTIAALVDLQYDFHPNVNFPEIFSYEHWKKQQRFLSAVMDTEVMRRAENFLMDAELIKKPLMEVLEDIWFGLYSRSDPKGVNGSSGFEHVFAGETKKNEVLGFHNWIYFFQEQDVNAAFANLSNDGSQGAMLIFLRDKAETLALGVAWISRDRQLSTGSVTKKACSSLQLWVYDVCYLEKSSHDGNLMAQREFSTNICSFNGRFSTEVFCPSLLSLVATKRQ